ncbi:MAG: hypothetical protein KAS21_01800 [Candidatus Aminicenantes bacterium]|nr:hypothetical protein [Candidatus Aminicenantes bacterium]
MKKVLLGILVLTMLLAMGYSQSITVTAPRADEVVSKGAEYVIRWTSEGPLTEGAKIRLFNSAGSSKIMDIANRADMASGRFRCADDLFNSVPDGRYVVRVLSADDLYHDDSEIFTLGNPGVDPDPDPEPEPERDSKSIRIDYPTGRDLAQGGTIKILWKPKNLTNNVTITLWKNGMLFGIIESGLAPGRISTIWEVGRTTIKTALPDTGFRIRIEEQGSGIFGVSNTFEITPSRNIDLSCYIASARASRITRRVRVVVKVRCKNFPGVLNDVPVKIMLKKKSDGTICRTTTEIIRELTYRGHSYEYTVNARLSYTGCVTGTSIRNKMEVVAVVDPDDIFRDSTRLNNTAKKDVR